MDKDGPNFPEKRPCKMEQDTAWDFYKFANWIYQLNFWRFDPTKSFPVKFEQSYEIDMRTNKPKYKNKPELLLNLPSGNTEIFW